MDWLKFRLMRHCDPAKREKQSFYDAKIFQEIASSCSFSSLQIAMMAAAIFLCCSASAQINRIEYFWDADPGFGLGTALPITPGDSVGGGAGAVFSFSTIGLQPGLHTLYIRSRDAQGRWGVFSKKAIQIKEPVFPVAAAEYFFDADPGFGNGTPINVTPGDSVQLADTIPTNSLNPGIHTLYVRVRDTNGKWSVFSKRMIHIQQPVYPIEEAEYFYDTDPGFGNGTLIPITPGDSIDTLATINTALLSPGIHTAYIRTKSANDEWSVFSKRLIHIQYPEAPQIVAAEYFVDTDPGFGNGSAISLTAGDSVQANNFQIPTASLSLGIHMVYIRVKYSNNQWSVFSKKLIYIDNPADDPIVAAEYFIDADPGIGNATAINITQGDSVMTNFTAPTNALLIGGHWLYVRVKDAENRWSVYSKDSFYVGNFNCAIYGNGEIEMVGDTCRGTPITFIDKTASNSGVDANDYTREWDFFDDDSIDFTADTFANFTFNQTGTFNVELKINEIANPFCQEVILKTITIRNTDTTYNNVTICNGESYNAGGGNQTTSGTYYDTYPNRFGCDSVRVTNLTVDSNLAASVAISVDDSSVCTGVTATFTAVPVNGGSSPYYTWKVNGATVGAGYAFQGYNPFGISTLTNGDTVTCEMLSSISCATSNPATSNSIIMQATQSLTASITITVDTNNFCQGTTATFTVTNVVNGGSNPQYDWYVDNVPVQSGGDTFATSALVNGNFIRCYLTSDMACVSNPTVSNRIDMTVFTNGAPSVSIGANTNNVCYGTPITFTASRSFEGNNPNYEWFLNGNSMQNGSSNVYSNDTLDDGDAVSCVLTSDYQCRLAGTDTSNTVTMDIIYSLPVGVTLTPSGNNICKGTSVTFTAGVTNGGSPNYEFFVNGTSVQNSTLYYYSSSTLNNNDSVWVVVTSDIICATNNPATSDKVYMTVADYDTVSVSISVTDDTICEATNVIFTAAATNSGSAPTYNWRVNNIVMQSSAADTFSSSSLGNGSIVRCELYGDHQCVTPVPAVSNSITMNVIDTILPSVIVSIPQTTICQGTNVQFDATLNNEGNNPIVEWLLNSNVVQNGGLSYSSSTLQNFDAIRARLTTDYECPVQNPVLSNNVVMTVIDSITPAVFVYHGPNPACPGNLISVFTTTSTGGDAPTYEFRVNGDSVQSGPSSQYTSANFNDGDIVQVTMTSNAECIRTAAALSNPDTIRILSVVPAGVSIQILSQGSCAGDSVRFQAFPVNGGSNPIFTWRVNNAVFQSSGSDVFTSTALQDGDSVFCEMNSSLSCATNNPARSNTLFVQFTGCCLTNAECADGDLCTVDSCNSGTCEIFTVNCNDNNGCTSDNCVDGFCVNAPVNCNDQNFCTTDTCVGGNCVNTPVVCDDGDLCTVDGCSVQSGCVFAAVDCADADPCTNDGCDTLSGLCAHDTIPGCGNPCDTLTCFDNDLCTADGCDPLSGCAFTPVNCNDNNACTVNSCETATGCTFTPISCDDADSCTIDGCDPFSGCFNISDPSCLFDCDNLVCDDADECTTDNCDSSSGCFFTPVTCSDNDLCTADGCHPVSGCDFTSVNCSDGDPCTDDYCDGLTGLCAHDSIPNCNDPCDTLVCFDNDLCTIDTCINGVCENNNVICNDNDLCTTDGCDSGQCVYTPVDCEDGDLCTTDYCDALDGFCYSDLVNVDDGDECTIDMCVNGVVTHNPVVCDDGNLCTLDSCSSAAGCFYPPLNCEDGNICTDDYCDTLTGLCAQDSIPNCGDPCDTIACSDNDLCTADTCMNGACEFNGIDCDDSNLCTTDGCDPLSGCTFTATNCSDGDPCTNDGCDTLSGLCVNDTIPGCGDPCDTLICFDSDLCTIDTCFNGVCKFNNVICNDNDLCTTDSCETGLCIYAPVDCQDGDLCTTDYCDVSDGFCYSDPINVDDGDACTIDSCVNGVVIHNPVMCDDGNLCTLDSCSSSSGCFFSPENCEDGDTCTDDYCDPLNGQCIHDIVSGCGDPCDTLVCADSDLCTADTCLNGACVFNNVVCNDGDVCSLDSCNSQTGCFYAPVSCDDASLCTTDNCNSQSGCVFTPIICADNDLCTADGCDALSGCAFPPINCNDANLCTTDSCDQLAGCVFTPVICNDSDTCTIDVCVNGNCYFQNRCCQTVADCNDGDLCTDESCSNGVCDFASLNCDDNDACTNDFCSIGSCFHSPLSCADGSPCTIDSCINGTCMFIPLNCDDSDSCTNDVCVNGICLNRPLNCADGNPCTIDFCAGGICRNELMNCDDGNDCTRDFCQNGICKNVTISCADGNLCTIDSCAGGVCINPLINCDDGDSCTTDFCQNGVCQNRPKICADANACTTDSCIGGACQYFPLDCDDANGCTDDYCFNGLCKNVVGNCDDSNPCTDDQCLNDICVNAPVNCDDSDPCTADSCTNGLCSSQPIDCNDFDSCTQDSCVNGQCINTPVASCDDSDPCTIDQCDPAGCINTPVDCNDLDSCTVDECVNGTCQNTIINCDDGDPCTDDVCQNGNCAHAPLICNDNNPCTADSCANGGCVFADERRVLSFTLVDAATDLDLGLLNDGDTIDLSITPSVSVRADVCATSDIESVKFLLNDSFHIMENIPFYTIAGDNGGNYNPWNVQPGVYTIRAIPYSGNNGTGIIGIYHEITIVIIDGTPPPPCNGDIRQVVDFTLVDAAADQDLGALLDGDTIDLSVTPFITVRANVCLEDSIESVEFLLNGNFHIMENLLFYTIAGDNGGNYNPWNVQPGVYTIRAIPYSGNNGAGVTGTYREITIVVIDGNQPCQVSDIAVTSFTLVDAASNTDIGPLADGAVVDLSATGPINVRADVFCGEHIESVKFKLNTNSSFRIENIAPYALAGDNNSNYYNWNVQPGVYTITATPFGGNNATGVAGTPLSITITIAGSAAKMDGSTVANEVEDKNMTLQSYPNPFKDILIIEFSLPQDSRANLDIFDVAGRKIATLFEGAMKADENQKLEFSPGFVPGGIIIYRLQTEQNIWYGKAVRIVR